ncbi:MAG: 30S ribosomal protein S7 [Dehalococcoidia bacterium]|nr:30S ribosomal protein S7 [Dehalococcoidia bacterium]MDW8119318.1 30S ribosomal protein S7 [Chloroflexota bacterium]
MRRHRAEPRPVKPDPIYNSETIARLINKVMQRGKKTVAQRIVYRALARIENQANRHPVEVVEEAIRRATPLLQVKPRRVGGATYQVPVEVHPLRGRSLAMRWLVQAARARKGRPMEERLAAEILDAAKGEGAAVKRREDLHKMAEANRAFVHYRW